MKYLKNEDMDVATPIGAVMSREIGCKEGEFSTEVGNKLATPVRPTLHLPYSSASGNAEEALDQHICGVALLCLVPGPTFACPE